MLGLSWRTSANAAPSMDIDASTPVNSAASARLLCDLTSVQAMSTTGEYADSKDDVSSYGGDPGSIQDRGENRGRGPSLPNDPEGGAPAQDVQQEAPISPRPALLNILSTNVPHVFSERYHAGLLVKQTHPAWRSGAVSQAEGRLASFTM